MCYPFFFIKFLFPCPLVCKPLRKHALPDQTHAGFLFNLIRNPRGYQYIGTSPFPNSFRFVSQNHIRIQNIIVTERLGHHPQNSTPGGTHKIPVCHVRHKKHLSLSYSPPRRDHFQWTRTMTSPIIRINNFYKKKKKKPGLILPAPKISIPPTS